MTNNCLARIATALCAFTFLYACGGPPEDKKTPAMPTPILESPGSITLPYATNYSLKDLTGGRFLVTTNLTAPTKIILPAPGWLHVIAAESRVAGNPADTRRDRELIPLATPNGAHFDGGFGGPLDLQHRYTLVWDGTMTPTAQVGGKVISLVPGKIVVETGSLAEHINAFLARTAAPTFRWAGKEEACPKTRQEVSPWGPDQFRIACKTQDMKNYLVAMLFSRTDHLEKGNADIMVGRLEEDEKASVNIDSPRPQPQQP